MAHTEFAYEPYQTIDLFNPFQQIYLKYLKIHLKIKKNFFEISF